MKVPLMDLKIQYRSIKKEVNKAAQKVLEEQSFILGKEVEALERSVASYCGVKYAIGVNSGTDALILALKAAGVGEKDEVITTPFTFIATAEAIVQLGAKPVFCDIDPRTYNIDPGLIEKKINRRTRAILPVHLFGLCAEMGPMMSIARKHGLKVIEDCAQAIGSEYKGRKAGSIGDAATLSFFPSKNLGGCGDGGMVLTNNIDIAKKSRLFRNHGSSEKYIHSVIGYNSRLDNLQAAILNIKFKYLDKWLQARIKTAEYYNKALKGLPLVTPFAPGYCKHTYHLYVLKTAGQPAASLVDHLRKNNIESRSYYHVPLHMQECFRYLKYKKGDMPFTEEASETTLAIPIYPEIKESEKAYIVSTIKNFFK